MANIYVTADQHFGHANIIYMTKRPHKDVNHMNQDLVAKWNETVKEDDVVYVLGDFCFKHPPNQGYRYWATQLHGNKTFIEGNHDSHNQVPSRLESGILSFGGFRIGIAHDPADLEHVTCGLGICGHVHGAWTHNWIQKGELLVINVGVDMWQMKPVSLLAVLGLARKHIKQNLSLGERLAWAEAHRDYYAKGEKYVGSASN